MSSIYLRLSILLKIRVVQKLAERDLTPTVIHQIAALEQLRKFLFSREIIISGSQSVRSDMIFAIVSKSMR